MKNYMRPPIPDGFYHVSGTWDKAFIIEDVKNKNQFTWIPIGICDLSNEYFVKLMRALDDRKIKHDFTKGMICRYEGIYISTHIISKTNIDRATSIQGEQWNNVTFRTAKDEAAKICKEFVGTKAHTRLLYGVEYDMIAECISILSGKALTDEVFEEYGLYGMNDLWFWTLTNHSEFSMILKKGDSRGKSDVYANNEWYESPKVGFRSALVLF